MNSKTILLVEDNPSDIELTKRAFVREHITNELVVVEDGQTALVTWGPYCATRRARKTPRKQGDSGFNLLQNLDPKSLDYLFGAGRHAGRDLNHMPTLILLDLKLPIIDGLEVLRRIRADERTRRLPVVVLTSSEEEQDVAASYDLGVKSYIRKPVDFHHFAEAIKLLGLYWLVVNEPPPHR